MLQHMDAVLGEQLLDPALKGTINFWANATASMPPATNASTIYTQYLCQVPRLRDSASLVASVFIADLVLLQAVWIVFSSLVLWWKQRSDPLAMHCGGCVEMGVGGQRRFSDEELEGHIVERGKVD